MTELAIVRPAQPSDRAALLLLLRLHHKESGFGVFDEESAGATLDFAMQRTAPIFAGVIAGAEGPEATIGLSIARFWNEAEDHLQALWNYVGDQFRDAGHAKKLMRFAEIAAERCGCPLIMGGPIRVGGEGKVHAYCKAMRPAGAFFMYDGPDMPRGTKKQREERADLLIKAFAGAGK